MGDSGRLRVIQNAVEQCGWPQHEKQRPRNNAAGHKTRSNTLAALGTRGQISLHSVHSPGRQQQSTGSTFVTLCAATIPFTPSQGVSRQHLAARHLPQVQQQLQRAHNCIQRGAAGEARTRAASGTPVSSNHSGENNSGGRTEARG